MSSRQEFIGPPHRARRGCPRGARLSTVTTYRIARYPGRTSARTGRAPPRRRSPLVLRPPVHRSPRQVGQPTSRDSIAMQTHSPRPYSPGFGPASGQPYSSSSRPVELQRALRDSPGRSPGLSRTRHRRAVLARRPTDAPHGPCVPLERGPHSLVASVSAVLRCRGLRCVSRSTVGQREEGRGRDDALPSSLRDGVVAADGPGHGKWPAARAIVFFARTSRPSRFGTSR